MLKRPKISIIVPVYKTDYSQLEKSVYSLIKQTYQNLEIILIDDGSPDQCGIICDSFQQRDSRVIVMHKKNEGVSSARNTGINISSGEYILFVDSDDYITLDMCEKLVDIQMEYPNHVIFFNYAKVFNKATVPIKFINKKIAFYEKDGTKSFNIFDMKIMGYITHCLYPKDLISNIRFNVNLPNSQDVEFNFRIFPLIERALYYNDVMYYYRQNENSAVRKYDENKIEKYSRTIQAIKYDANCVLQTQAYYSFIAITFIMLILNTIFNVNNPSTFHEKRIQIRNLKAQTHYKDLMNHMGCIKLPISRKCIVYFAKYNFDLFICIVIKTKQLIDKKRNKS